MNERDVFWNLGALSDRQLVERLGSVLGSSRRLMAELIAHLGEVEERRLHLMAACSSMFAYCLKLGMTEDEAYRRIEVARLARRYPAIFPLLADGRLTISTAALLKHYLCHENHLELLAAAAGKSVVQTRELIAARFPRPDVSSSVRKLPERRAVTQPSLASSIPTEPLGGGTKPCTGRTEPSMGGTQPCAVALAGTTQPSQRVTPPGAASRVEPLSAQRYKVQFTAGAELTRKLALAKDLLRHSHPGGELGPIVERALDLLIESLMQRRFGTREKASSKRASVRAVPSDLEQRTDAIDDRSEMRRQRAPTNSTPHAAKPRMPEPTDSTQRTAMPEDETLDTATLQTATPRAVTLDAAAPDSVGPGIPTTADIPEVYGGQRAEPTVASVCSYLPRSARRAVVERNGLGCSWADEHGVRCGSRAWLEYDHRCPRAKGGGSEPDNLRLLCRAHNRFAAEREYGRKHVEHAIAERRRESERLTCRTRYDG